MFDCRTQKVWTYFVIYTQKVMFSKHVVWPLCNFVGFGVLMHHKPLLRFLNIFLFVELDPSLEHLQNTNNMIYL